MKLAVLSAAVTGTLAGSADTACGAFTRFAAPGFEECASEDCSKIRINCPDGFTPSFENSLKCKGETWKGIGADEIITCDMDYKPCDYDKLAATSDDVVTKCDGDSCDFSCSDGSEVSVSSVKCDTQFGNWEYAGTDSKPGKIRCAGIPKPKKPTKAPKESDCAPFDNYDADSVEKISCDDKRCTFECKDGFHSITSANAKCKSAGYWKLSDGAQRVTCFGNGNSWMNGWDSNVVDAPFDCDPDDLRRVDLKNCEDLEDGAITNCDVLCRGVKIDEVRCINHRPVWSNEYFDC